MDNTVLAIIVSTGIMGGGLVALALLAPRRNQNIFALMGLIALVLGLAAGLETQDYREGLPPVLLRPFYLNRLKHQYAAIGRSPARATHLRLAQKVQDRLARRAKVYICFYNDQPGLAEAAATAIRDG